MKKIIALIVICTSIFALTACKNQDSSIVNPRTFSLLENSEYIAVGRSIDKQGLDFKFDNYDTYVPLSSKNSDRFVGSASVVALNIPPKFIDPLPKDTMTAYDPDWVYAILAQSFVKAELEKKFICINGGRYFASELKEFALYENNEIVVYNILPIMISEEYEQYLNSQKPIVNSADSIRVYDHWDDGYAEKLKNAVNQVKVASP